jgi:acyl-homoserine-lactone acylase
MNVSVPTGALPSASLEPTPERPVPVPGRDRSGLAVGGYQITYGTSFLMAVELTPAGPHGFGLLAYGQNEDPRSPHHADGTAAFAAARVRPLLFTDDQIEADPELTRLRLASEP